MAADPGKDWSDEPEDAGPPPADTGRKSGGALGALRVLITGILLPGAILVGGYLAGDHLLSNRPRAQRKTRVASARLVEIVPVVIGDHRTTVTAMGTVREARTMQLRARVSGSVVRVSRSLVPGGRFKAGEDVLFLDESDFLLAVTQRENDLERARSALKIEEGQQAVARREFELLGETIREEDRELVLRVPQLDIAKANIAAAQAALDQATLNKDRTTVKAPFNALVRSRSADVGVQVTPSTNLAELVGTDEMWVEALVPVDRLRWIRMPKTLEEKGSPAKIRNSAAWGKDGFRDGRVVRLLGDLDDRGRMARLLIAVPDPLALKKQNAGRPELLLGSYVRVEITGQELRSVAVVPRTLLRDGNRVWIMDAEDRLEIRPVEVAFRSDDSVCVASGLAAGDRIVVTELPAPVPGLPLRVRDAKPPPAGPDRGPAEEASR